MRSYLGASHLRMLRALSRGGLVGGAVMVAVAE